MEQCDKTAEVKSSGFRIERQQQKSGGQVSEGWLVLWKLGRCNEELAIELTRKNHGSGWKVAVRKIGRIKKLFDAD